jgi:hypothetical protein
MYGVKRNAYGFWWGNLKQRQLIVDLGVYGGLRQKNQEAVAENRPTTIAGGCGE